MAGAPPVADGRGTHDETEPLVNRIGLSTVAGGPPGYGPSCSTLGQPLQSGARHGSNAQASHGATLHTSAAVARLAPR